MTVHPVPAPGDRRRFPMYTQEFAADPHAAYRRMRDEYGALVPVELHPERNATLVVDHAMALRILNDPVSFPADPREWQQTVPADCPLLPMIGYRENALRSAGREHARYRASNVDALRGVALHEVERTVRRAARRSINRFCARGEADFLNEFAKPVVLGSISDMAGAPNQLARRIGTSMKAVFEGGADAEQANNVLMKALQDLINLKRACPDDDLVTRLIQHESALTDPELAQQLVTVFGAGYEPTTNTIANTELRIQTSAQVMDGVSSGALSIREALDEGLFSDPPMANYCLSYPPRAVVMDDHQVLLAHQPVVISLAACNNDPALGGLEQRLGNRAHLAFSTGPHACPAADMSMIIAQAALDEVTEALPDMRLAISPDEVRWRPGPFHRALAALPVSFAPTPPLTD
ncbi:cytochrome P450 [Streptomyces sp. NPDC052042]|uniref:cytochrome P450 n=1 Tax=Streptomyces sp. NPDC052042 TaxID=3365683 RepID=UPI0037D17128